MRLKPFAAGQRTAINPEGRTPIPSKPPAAATKSSPRPPPLSRTASEFASATHSPPQPPHNWLRSSTSALPRPPTGVLLRRQKGYPVQMHLVAGEAVLEHASLHV